MPARDLPESVQEISAASCGLFAQWPNLNLTDGMSILVCGRSENSRRAEGLEGDLILGKSFDPPPLVSAASLERNYPR